MNAAWIDGGIEEGVPQGAKAPSVLIAEEVIIYLTDCTPV
jgi:hypothetical protein